MYTSSVCITNSCQLSLPHQSTTNKSFARNVVAYFPCVNSTIPACLRVTCPTSSSSSLSHSVRAGPLLIDSKEWLAILFFSFFFLFHFIYSTFTSFFHLAFFFIHFPPSCCLCPLPWHPSLSLILLCGGFAVDSPRHEWSISRSPGGSSPYNSVQWAWIVSQSTQKNLSVNTVLLWAASLQWCVRIKRRRRRNFLNLSCWAGINMMPEV